MTKVDLDLLAFMMIELGKEPLRRKRFLLVLQVKQDMPVSMFNSYLRFLKEKRWIEKENGKMGRYSLSPRGTAFLEGWRRSHQN